MSRRGLSLLEMLIVFVLSAVMMALSLPMLSTANARARSELCQQNLVEIGQSVASFTQDNNYLPTLYMAEPKPDGWLLAEFIEPRLQASHVLFCPSDETEQSQALGTSYHWASVMNGLEPRQWDTYLGQSILSDREGYHAEPDRPINGLILAQDGSGFELALVGMNEESDLPKITLKGKHDKPKNQPHDRGLPEGQREGLDED